MAAEPINIFSHKIDPRGVVRVLRALVPGLQIVGPEDAWEKIVIGGARRLLRKAPTLTFLHKPDYYDGPGWPTQVAGMGGYFARFPDVPRKADILRLIGSFRFILATDFQPEREDDDDRLRYVLAVAQHLDGVIFMPSCLLDAAGRILIAADGESDPEAVLPRLPPTADHPEAETDEAGSHQAIDRKPPTAERVARRALALAAVAARSFVERQDAADPQTEKTRQQILDWLAALDLGDELEPDEWQVIQRPVGRLEEQAALDSSWRIEGLAVLAWALGRFELPAYDEEADPQAVLDALGTLDQEAARALLDRPTLREADEFEKLYWQVVAVHWRLREYTLRPQAVAFEKFPDKGGWFGHFDLSDCRFIDGDLALRGSAVHGCPEAIFRAVLSTTQERHVAINWLLGDAAVYSQTDTST